MIINNHFSSCVLSQAAGLYVLPPLPGRIGKRGQCLVKSQIIAIKLQFCKPIILCLPKSPFISHSSSLPTSEIQAIFTLFRKE